MCVCVCALVGNSHDISLKRIRSLARASSPAFASDVIRWELRLAYSRNFSNCLRRFSYHFTHSTHIQNIPEKYVSGFHADSYMKNSMRIPIESIVDSEYILNLRFFFRVKGMRFSYEIILCYCLLTEGHFV